MRSRLLTAVSALVLGFTYALPSHAQLCNNTIYNCNTNVVNEQFSDTDIVVIPDFSYARSTANIPDVSYFDKKNSNLSDCGVSNDCNFDGAALTYTIYYPSSSAYPCYQAQPLPAMFLFRGSGFSDCFDSGESMSDYCLAFAKRGFVVFDVNYRTGRIKNPTGQLTASQMLAMYRTFQDARGAIRTAILLNGKTGFRFDTSNIFIGGASAGGEIALNVAYTSSEILNEQIFPGVSDVLGPIDADFYKGSPDIRFSIKAVLNLWGAAFLNGSVNPATFIKQNASNPPLIAFHGMIDSVLWITSQKVPLSNTSPYNYESSCLLRDSNNKKQVYAIPDNLKVLYQSGSAALYDILTGQLTSFIPCEVYLDSDMGHGLGKRSDFGFGDGKISTADLKQYIVQRAATFFQTVVNSKAADLKTTYFQDCVNYRNRACLKIELNDRTGCKPSHIGLLPADQLQNSSTGMTIAASYNNIVVHFPQISSATVSVYNLNGVLVKRLHTNFVMAAMGTQDLKSGIYLVVVTQGTAIKKSTVFLP